MGWFIAGLVVLMMIGSILWIRPSPADRRRMEMRQRAMQLGLQVRIEHLEVPGEDRPRQRVAYTLRRTPEQVEAFDPTRDHWTLVRKQTAFLDEASGEWSWLVKPSDPPPIPSGVLRALPATADALGSSRGGVTLYWEESGEPDGLDQLVAVMREALPA